MTRDRRYLDAMRAMVDRKSTRLNSSHSQISYAVFCLKKKKKKSTKLNSELSEQITLHLPPMIPESLLACLTTTYPVIHTRRLRPRSSTDTSSLVQHA